MAVTDAMEAKIVKYAQKLPHFDHGLMSLKVTLDAEKGDQSAELIAKSRHSTFVAKHLSHDLYECIREAFCKLESQIVRHHDKIVNHRLTEPAEKAPMPESEEE